jgi:hypothetical protein
MRAVLLLFLLSVINIPLARADGLYVWTDENGVAQSSAMKPADWKDQQWKHTKTQKGRKAQNGTATEGKREAGSLRPGASFEGRHSGAGVGPGVSSRVIIEK